MNTDKKQLLSGVNRYNYRRFAALIVGQMRFGGLLLMIK